MLHAKIQARAQWRVRVQTSNCSLHFLHYGTEGKCKDSPHDQTRISVSVSLNKYLRQCCLECRDSGDLILFLSLALSFWMPKWAGHFPSLCLSFLIWKRMMMCFDVLVKYFDCCDDKHYIRALVTLLKIKGEKPEKKNQVHSKALTPRKQIKRLFFGEPYLWFLSICGCCNIKCTPIKYIY